MTAKIRTHELIVNVPRANTQAPQISRSGDLDLGSNFDRGARPDEPSEPSPGKWLNTIKQFFTDFKGETQKFRLLEISNFSF